VLSRACDGKCLSALVFLWSDALVIKQTPSAYHRGSAG
jgi:hypothetical protein